MFNTGRITAVAQGKALTTQVSSQIVTGTAGSSTAPLPPLIRQDMRMDVDDGPPLNDNKLEDKTV